MVVLYLCQVGFFFVDACVYYCCSHCVCHCSFIRGAVRVDYLSFILRLSSAVPLISRFHHFWHELCMLIVTWSSRLIRGYSLRLFYSGVFAIRTFRSPLRWLAPSATCVSIYCSDCLLCVCVFNLVWLLSFFELHHCFCCCSRASCVLYCSFMLCSFAFVFRVKYVCLLIVVGSYPSLSVFVLGVICLMLLGVDAFARVDILLLFPIGCDFLEIKSLVLCLLARHDLFDVDCHCYVC